MTRSFEGWLVVEGASRARVARLEVVEELSQITHAEVLIHLDVEIDAAAWVGCRASVELYETGLLARSWTLVVSEVEMRDSLADGLLYRVELRSPMHALEHARDTRKFLGLRHVDIVRQVCEEHGVRCAIKTTQSLPGVPFCIQYREQTYAFVRRILAHDGVYFRADESGQVVLQDDSRAAELCVDFPLELWTGVVSDVVDDGLLEFRRVARVTAGKASVSDYDWKNPHRSLFRSTAAARDSDLEQYNFPEGFRDPQEGDRIARIRLERLRCRSVIVDGRSNAAALEAGYAFCAGPSVGSRSAGEYTLIRVLHRLHRVFSPQGEADVYGNEFTAIPRGVPYRPAEESRPVVAGHQTVVVRGPAGEDVHTDAHGRFKAQFHWDRQAHETDVDSPWIRLAQELSSSAAVARVGSELMVAHVDGDPTRPIGIARLHNAVSAPVHPVPSNKNVMTIRTLTSPTRDEYNEICLDDTRGAMVFAIRGQNDISTHVRDTRAVTVAGAESVYARNDVRLRAEGSRFVTIAADNALQCAKYAENVSEGARLRTGGNESQSLSRRCSVTVAGSDTERVGGDRTVSSTGQITRYVADSYSRDVGGGVRQQHGSHQTHVGEALTTSIGGDCTLTTGASISMTVRGRCDWSASADATLTAGAESGWGGRRTTIDVGAGAVVRAGKTLEVRSEQVILRATDRMRLASGRGHVTLTPQLVSIGGEVELESGEAVRTSGRRDILSRVP